MRAFEFFRRKPVPFHIYGTAAGREAWLANRDELKKQLEMHRSALRAEHHRYSDDQCDDQRELELTVRSLTIADQVIRNFKIIEPATDNSCVDIGVVVTYREYDDEGVPGKPVALQVGEYGQADVHADPRIMPYDNQVLLQLFGCRVGEIRSVKLTNDREREFEILDIRLPTARPELKMIA